MTFPETRYGLGFCSPHTKAELAFCDDRYSAEVNPTVTIQYGEVDVLLRKEVETVVLRGRMLEWDEEQRREANQIFGGRKISVVPEPPSKELAATQRDQCERCWAERLMTQIKGP
jgi:hypothetical protein